jgi:hypothetical protein
VESLLDIGALELGHDFSMDRLMVSRSLLDVLESGNAAQHCSGLAGVENVGPVVLAGLVSWSSLCLCLHDGVLFCSPAMDVETVSTNSVLLWLGLVYYAYQLVGLLCFMVLVASLVVVFVVGGGDNGGRSSYG